MSFRFVIRDDDLNYFSTPEDIERWYADIFAQGVPVGFSVVPFVKGTSDVYTAGAAKEQREFPVSGNRALVEYVKGNPLIEVMQHGCTHETVQGVYEYQKQESLAEDTRRGRQELEHAFGTRVGVFVPPHDWIGVSGVRGVEAAGMDIIRGRGAGLRNGIFRGAYLKNFLRMFFFKLVHLGHVPAYPYVLDFGAHKEQCSYRLEDVDVFDGLAYADRVGGAFVVVAHVHTMTAEKKDRLVRLIAQARKSGAQFVRPSDLFS